jgi:hypothetical protein
MQLYLKQSFWIFLIFFLLLLLDALPGSRHAFAQHFIQALEDVPLRQHGSALPMPWGGGLNAALLQTADLNGDGREELISLDRSSQSMMVFGREEGQWQPRPDLLCLLPPDISNWFIMADNDGDGLKDIFTFTSAGIRVFRNEAAAGQAASFALLSETINYESNNRQVNLLVNSSDVPAIMDVDGDGDLDILAYDPAGGGGLHFYKNMSVENAGQPGQLLYVQESRRWGGLMECNCNDFAYLDESCDNKRAGSRLQHAGGKSLLLYDVDGDGDLDLLNGFEECQGLYYLENKGTEHKPRFDSFHKLLPGTDEEVAIGYPAAFLLDADQDGHQDLIVSSQLGRNTGLEYDLSQSLWWYEVLEQEGQKQYRLQTKAFLQEEMLDAGANTVPAFMDIDADGDEDLLLGSYGLPQEDGFYAGLKLYENKGTASAPAFELTDEDYLQLKTQKLIGLNPQFIDFNGNGSLDLLLVATETVRFQRKAFLYLNQAPASVAAEFNSLAPIELPLSFSTQDNPFFYDIDGDGLADLLLGRFDGSLSVFRNEGTAQAPQFGSGEKAFLSLGLDNFRRPLVPAVGDLTGNGQADLLLADGSGSIRYIKNFLQKRDEEPDLQTLLLCAGSDKQLSPFGRRSWPRAVSLHRPGVPVLVIGNMQGGLWMYQPENVDNPEIGDQPEFKVFPNPVSVHTQKAYVKSSADARIRLISVKGQLLLQFNAKAGQPEELRLQGLTPGLYLLQAVTANGKKSAKLIVIE